MLQVDHESGHVTQCLGQLVLCLNHNISEASTTRSWRTFTFWWIELALDIIQHVSDVNLSRVVPHDGLVWDGGVRHICLFEVIHEAFGVIEWDILDAASWKVKLCKYITASIALATE